MTKTRTIAALVLATASIAFAAPAFACEDSLVALDSRGLFNTFVTDTDGEGNQVATTQRGIYNASASQITGDCNTLVEYQGGFAASEPTMNGDGLAAATRLRNATATVSLTGSDIAGIVDAENSDVNLKVIGEGARVVVRSR